jgi:NADH oxidase (H2O2-forming)
MEDRDVVIIGGGPAGRTIVHMLHASGRKLSVTLIKNEATNANRCAIPYGISGSKPIEKFQIPNELVTEFGAELVVDRVSKIDPAEKLVYTAGGQTFRYADLVLATGARPVIPPIPGIEGEAITPVRSIEDLATLRDFATKGQHAVVVGGGYIGIEVSVALRQMGLDVTVLEMLPRILLATIEPEFIDHVEDTLRANGIRVLTGEKVVAFEHQRDKHVTIRLASGAPLVADFVVLSAGVALETELAEQAGIKTSRAGICADTHLRTTADNVYTCGDCAEKRSYVTRRPTRGEFGTNAVFMAKVVARNILGDPIEFPGVINANATTVYDLSLGSAGLTEQMARDAGFQVVTGWSEVPNKYPMMDAVQPVRAKLVFNRKNKRLIGGSVMQKGSCTAQSVDFISLAIQMGATMDDLGNYQYCTHPELAAKPSDNIYTFATRDAVGNSSRPHQN